MSFWFSLARRALCAWESDALRLLTREGRTTVNGVGRCGVYPGVRSWAARGDRGRGRIRRGDVLPTVVTGGDDERSSDAETTGPPNRARSSAIVGWPCWPGATVCRRPRLR